MAKDDEYYMELALKEAQRAYAEDDGDEHRGDFAGAEKALGLHALRNAGAVYDVRGGAVDDAD